MSNDFGKTVEVAFEQLLPAFSDKLVLSEAVNLYKTNPTDMERANNTIWNPMPYIGRSYDGTDATANMNDHTQLLVPSQVNINKYSTFVLSSNELNDQLQQGMLGKAQVQKLASDINISVASTLANQGSLVVKRTTAASGFDDVSQCDTLLNEQGVNEGDRFLALSSGAYNSMAGNLAARETMNDAPTKAYRDAYVGRIAGFNTLKLDYSTTLAAAAGTTVSINGANQYYTPVARRTASTGEQSNVDNRYQTISITVGGGTVAVGDCFTVDDVYAVHHVTKESTGNLKTFRIVELVTGAGGTGTVKITPPFISNGGGTDAEAQYQNIDSTPANSATVNFLNTVAGKVNPFWVKDSVKLMPGRLVMPTDAGVKVMSATTKNGIQIMMTEQFNSHTMKNDYILRVFYGVTMTNPEMAGIMLFSQS